MSRLYTVDPALVTERPEIRIGDKVYAVDNRMSVFLQMDTALRNRSEAESEIDVILRHALGETALEAIHALDIPFPAMRRLIVLVMAAVQDIAEDEAERRFQLGATGK